jgi:hypothetical protein
MYGQSVNDKIKKIPHRKSLSRQKLDNAHQNNPLTNAPNVIPAKGLPST